MADVIQVGKYTLESLTTGMYSDPKIIYREYIQNSVDSLENAQFSSRQAVRKASQRGSGSSFQAHSRPPLKTSAFISLE